MIKIYHYSDKDFKRYLRPDFFGDNNYSGNSARLSQVKRIYFYQNRQGREYQFNSAKYLYIALVDKSRVYDLSRDNKGIVKNLKAGQDIYSEVKKAGYIGLAGNNGFKCITIFKPVKILKRLTLTK